MAVPKYYLQPGIERVQALAGISRWTLCCYSNETRAPNTNPPNNAQLDDTPTIPPTYIRVRAVMWDWDRQTLHFASATPHAKYN